MRAFLARAELHSTRGVVSLPGQGVAAKIKGIGASPGLDSSQVAHVLGDGRGCHADLVVAQMETKGIGRIDFYEVGDVFLFATTKLMSIRTFASSLLQMSSSKRLKIWTNTNMGCKSTWTTFIRVLGFLASRGVDICSE